MRKARVGVRTKIDRVNPLNGLPWLNRRDLRSSDDCANEDIVVQRDQPKSALGIIDDSVAIQIERSSRRELDHAAWRNILPMAAQCYAG